MRSAVLTLLGLCLAGVLAVLVVGGARETRMAFTAGVSSAGAQAAIAPGQTGCQGPLDVPEGGSFDAVEVVLATGALPGAPARVTVVDTATGRVLARGRLPGGYLGTAQQRIAVDPRVPEGRSIRVCLKNTGAIPIVPMGNGDAASPPSTYTRNGQPQGVDIAMRFQTRPRSLLSQFGLIADRAALFRAGWVGPWTYWLLAALLALGVPALLAFALARAGREQPSGD
jgi:hypothetical protein